MNYILLVGMFNIVCMYNINEFSEKIWIFVCNTQSMYIMFHLQKMPINLDNFKISHY